MANGAFGRSDRVRYPAGPEARRTLRDGSRHAGRQGAGAGAGAEPLVHILWINGGLSCDGDSVALTAATQPSIEEIVLGALPGLPKVAVHWPLIDFECGPETGADNFIEWWHKADRGELEPFVLVVEGSIPNEAIKEEGYWCGFGNNPATGQPMTTNEWLDRLAPKATAILAVGTCATYGGIHAMAGNPTGAMGVPDYLGWDWRSKAGLPIVCVPGCPIHPDNLSETILYLLYQVAGAGADDSAGRGAAADLAVRRDRARGLRPRRLLRAGRLRDRVRLGEVPGQTRLLGSGREVQRAQTRLDQRRRRLPERRRHLHRLHDARLPRQVHAVHGRTAGSPRLHRGEHAYGTVIRKLRGITANTVDKEPKWRQKGERVATGYEPTGESAVLAADAHGVHDDRRNCHDDGRRQPT